MSQTHLKLSLILAMIAVGGVNPTKAREPKEYDQDIVYDEARIPSYTLPPALIDSVGRPVERAEDWWARRRPEILAQFANFVYGVIPEPEIPVQISTQVLSERGGSESMPMRRKDVQILIENSLGSKEMRVLVFSPETIEEPVPAILMQSFNNTWGDDFDEHPERPGFVRCGVPLGEMARRGYGFVAVYQKDLVDHNEVEFLGSIHRLFYRQGQSFPDANQWGCLSAIAWGGMRAMDYLEGDPDIDASRIAVMGHSKMGKAALWTAALDTRFAMAISAQSGCAGAALWRRRSGETLEKMVTRFPYWLCRNAWKFVGVEEDLPVDQHLLLGLVAPRPVYVHSAVDDTWADPRGEYLSAFHASEIYRLLGKEGLVSEETPELGSPIIESDVGYHIRAGGHSVELYDWLRFLDFADYHFLPLQ